MPLAVVLIIAVAGTFFGWSRTSTGLETWIPVSALERVPMADSDACEPSESFGRLSSIMTERALPLDDPRSLERLPNSVLAAFVDEALNCPDAYLSPPASTSSLAVISAWLSTATTAFLRPKIWRTCLQLRWLAADPGAIAEPCNRLLGRGGGWWLASELPQFAKGVQLDTTHPGLLRAIRRYQNNPFNPSRLATLIFLLDRHGHHSLVATLKRDLLALSVDKAVALENRLAPSAQSR